MTDDIVARARAFKPINHHPITAVRLLNEMAGEIERLRAELADDKAFISAQKKQIGQLLDWQVQLSAERDAAIALAEKAEKRREERDALSEELRAAQEWAKECACNAEINRLRVETLERGDESFKIRAQAQETINEWRARAEAAEAERDAAIARAAEWKQEIEKVADVWESMWRGKHSEARADWLINDIVAFINDQSGQMDAMREALKAAREVFSKPIKVAGDDIIIRGPINLAAIVLLIDKVLGGVDGKAD